MRLCLEKGKRDMPFLRGFWIPFFLGALGLGLFCTDYLTAPGPQPRYLVEPAGFEPRLCVFGVLRPDTAATGHPLSFVLVSRTFPPDTTAFPPPLRDAEVLLYAVDEIPPSDTLRLIYTNLGVFPDSAFRHPDFFPRPGKRYGLVCRHPGYPPLRGETCLPTRPRVIEGSFHYSEQGLSFSLHTDAQTGLIEVRLMTDQRLETREFLPSPSGTTPIFLPEKHPPGTPFRLQIVAYDRQLAVYRSANLSIKPNVFQPFFSTVEDGFGCFGSLAIATITDAY